VKCFAAMGKREEMERRERLASTSGPSVPFHSDEEELLLCSHKIETCKDAFQGVDVVTPWWTAQTS
jgi:hypothetical protein